jgi:hypothetical protein
MSGYTVLHGDAHDFAPPSWNPAEPARRTVELRPHGLRHSQANGNESDADVVSFAYGAPLQPADYEAEKLEDAYFS